MDKQDYTQEYREYETGVDYNNKIGYYSKTDLNWRMHNGQQWVGVVTNGLSKFTFNICKSAINYFIAFIMSQKVKMQYSAENLPDEPDDPQDIQVKQFVELMSKMADMKWEKDKMDSKLRQLMLDGAVTGDFAAHVFWDAKKETGQDEKGDFTTEIVDGVNILFGNPNNPLVEAQPYIEVVGRASVAELKKEAKENGIDESLIASISSDEDNQYQAGSMGKVELDAKGDNGKCNYIIKYWKDSSGQVYWNKSTKGCPIRKDVALGISRYPVAWGNWETIKNSYHGMSAIEGIIDNQISINQMFAMVAYWMRMSAFGKVVIDDSRIKGWSNKIGEAIRVDGDITGVVHQLEAGKFNAAILEVINLAIKYTKDFIGANDALMGQVNPEQASGTAIISTAKQASIPLGNISSNRDQFVEDLGLIWGEFFLKKYKNRKVSYKDNGKVMTDQYTTEGVDNILLQCKVDVGPSTYWSEIAGIQALDNLLKMKVITPLQYFERMKKMNIIPDAQGLIDDFQRIQLQQQMQAQQQSQQMKFEQMAQFVESQPPEVQAQLEQLRQDDPQGYEQTVVEMMGGGGGGMSAMQSSVTSGANIPNI